MKNKLEEIQDRILDLLEEKKRIPTPKSQLLIDDDDEYQEQLELCWYRRDIDEEIESLKQQLAEEKVLYNERKITLYYASFCFMESTHLYLTYRQAEQELHRILEMIYGKVPKYHDGFRVCDKEFEYNELYDFSENPYASYDFYVIN